MILDGTINRIMERLNEQYHALIGEVRTIRDYLCELVELAEEARDARKDPPHKKYRRD